MSIKDQFTSARAYIDAGDYREARRVLRGIDHPKAKDWLVRVDQLDPRPTNKALGYGLGLVSILASIIAAFALLVIVTAPINALPALLTFIVAAIITYITRTYGKRLRE